MRTRTRLAGATAVLALAVPLLLSACSNRADRPRVTRSASPAGAAQAPDLTLTPAADSKRLPVTAEIGASVRGGVAGTVTLTDASGRVVAGGWRSDGSSWVPASSLRYGTRYTAKVVAVGDGGATRTSTTSFTTMAAPKTRPITTSINIKDGATYGVAMPVVLEFGASIPAKDRAAVERRLFVSSVPAQAGIWSWASATEVVYRPQVHWKPRTVVSVRTALAGLPVGNRVISGDRSGSFMIGPDLEYAISDKTHMLTVTSDGKKLHTYPVSLGKPGHDSWSGNLVIMERDYYTVFDTLGIPGENYRVGVNFAERLTLSGTFIHSAPWSVYAQGHYDVSHGCVNVGPSNAKWIYENSHIGDPVSISGTGHPVADGNGWTAWDESWADFVKGSAIGVVQSPRANQSSPAM